MKGILQACWNTISSFLWGYMNSEGELTTVISAYRIAETKLNDIEDEIEHAEFYFKIS